MKKKLWLIIGCSIALLVLVKGLTLSKKDPREGPASASDSSVNLSVAEGASHQDAGIKQKIQLVKNKHKQEQPKETNGEVGGNREIKLLEGYQRYSKIHDNLFLHEERAMLMSELGADSSMRSLLVEYVADPDSMSSENEEITAELRVFSLDVLVSHAIESSSSELLVGLAKKVENDLNTSRSLSGRSADLSDLIDGIIQVHYDRFLSDPYTIVSQIPCSEKSFDALLEGITGAIKSKDRDTPTFVAFIGNLIKKRCQIFLGEEIK